MARKKFRNTERQISSSDRSFQEYLVNQPATQITRTELLRLIRGGEDTFLEFKVKLSNPERIAQEIVALANTAGGSILFGISDSLRIEGVRNAEAVQDEIVRICREDIYPPLVPFLDIISFDNGRRIVALDIEGKRRPYRTKEGRFYIRIGSEKREATREELSDLLDEVRPLSYENIPVINAVEADFDDALLWSFANSFEDDLLGKNIYNTANFLQKDLLMAIGNGDGEFLPTIAAVLLFGKNERVGELVPRSMVVAERISGDQTVECIRLEGNLLTLYEKASQFVARYCDLDKNKQKKSKSDDILPVEARKSYHIYSIREAIINALIHRDYALRDIPTRISIHDNYIEFANPRRTNGFIPPASRAIRYGITQRINPQIAAIFMKREYGANAPKGGLPMIIRSSRHFSDRRAEVYTSNDEFKLKIYGV